MISWGVARTIAVTLASRTEGVAPARHGAFDYPGAVREALGPLAGFTGIRLSDDVRPVRVRSWDFTAYF